MYNFIEINFLTQLDVVLFYSPPGVGTVSCDAGSKLLRLSGVTDKEAQIMLETGGVVAGNTYEPLVNKWIWFHSINNAFRIVSVAGYDSNGAYFYTDVEMPVSLLNVSFGLVSATAKEVQLTNTDTSVAALIGIAPHPLNGVLLPQQSITIKADDNKLLPPVIVDPSGGSGVSAIIKY